MIMKPLAEQPYPDRLQLESARCHATVHLTWDNKQKTWLLTAFDHTEPPSAKRTSIVPGTQKPVGETSPSPKEGGLVPPAPATSSRVHGAPDEGGAGPTPPATSGYTVLEYCER